MCSSNHPLPEAGSRLVDYRGNNLTVTGSVTTPSISPPALELSLPAEPDNGVSKDDCSVHSDTIRRSSRVKKEVDKLVVGDPTDPRFNRTRKK